MSRPEGQRVALGVGENDVAADRSCDGLEELSQCSTWGAVDLEKLRDGEAGAEVVGGVRR
jgi:hypothetical protein